MFDTGAVILLLLLLLSIAVRILLRVEGVVCLRTIGIHGAQSGKIRRPRRMTVDGELSQLEKADCQSDNRCLVEKIWRAKKAVAWMLAVWL